MKRHRAHGEPRPPHLLRDRQREARSVAPSIAEMYADVLGAGLAKSLADCCTKNTYSSEPAALGAATVLGWVGGIELEPYRCDWCNDYHLMTRRSA